MKYMLLIYSNPATWDALQPGELQKIMGEAEALMNELQERGEWLGGEALADPVTSRTVRVRDGEPIVTDGPYLETKEHLAGFCLIDCEPERAVEIGARWPDARYVAVELRPLMDAAGTDM